MINCYVIGEISTVELLCDYINSYPLTELKGFAFAAPDSFSPVFSIRPNIVFLDSRLLDSYEPWLSRIRQFSSIIIISDNTLKAFEAFENLAFDYLLKPLPFDRFIKSINKYSHLSELSTGNKSSGKRMITDSFFIKADSKGLKEVLIKCDNLVFIEALQNYVILHMLDGTKFTCYNTMKEMEEALPEQEFIRVHKSFIINDSKIISIEGNTILIQGAGKEKIVIGNAYKKAFLEKKNKRLIRKERPSVHLLHPAKVAFSITAICAIVSLFENFLCIDGLVFF